MVGDSFLAIGYHPDRVGPRQLVGSGDPDKVAELAVDPCCGALLQGRGWQGIVRAADERGRSGVLSNRAPLSQLGGGLFLTDAGLETALIYYDGVELFCFASFPLLETEE